MCWGAPCRQAVAYGMGWRIVDDCDLGRVVTHTGGYPGYGSVVILLPDKGVGLFAFSNRTYGAPSLPAFRAALALHGRLGHAAVSFIRKARARRQSRRRVLSLISNMPATSTSV